MKISCWCKVKLTDGPEVPGGPRGPGAPTVPWAPDLPSLPAGPWGPADPWNHHNTQLNHFLVVILHHIHLSVLASRCYRNIFFLSFISDILWLWHAAGWSLFLHWLHRHWCHCSTERTFKIQLTLGPEGPAGPAAPESPGGPWRKRKYTDEGHCSHSKTFSEWAASTNGTKILADVCSMSICSCIFNHWFSIVLMCSNSRKVQACPGDQDVHADPSCLSLPCLQHLPSHHGVQQVPKLTRHTFSNITFLVLKIPVI